MRGIAGGTLPSQAAEDPMTQNCGIIVILHREGLWRQAG